MDAFISILREVNVFGVDYFVNRTKLVCNVFQDNNTKITTGTHIFFNNFGPYFDTQKPKSLNHEFSEQIGFMSPQTNIITLKTLPEASKRIYCKTYDSMRNAASWNQNPLAICHYIKLSDTWRCSYCTFDNPFSEDSFINDVCSVCHRKSIAKRMSSNTKKHGKR